MDATDPDGDTVSYYIPTNSLNSNRFTVDNITGHVFTQPGVILDREVGPPTASTGQLHYSDMHILNEELICPKLPVFPCSVCRLMVQRVNAISIPHSSWLLTTRHSLCILRLQMETCIMLKTRYSHYSSSLKM